MTVGRRARDPQNPFLLNLLLNRARTWPPPLFDVLFCETNPIPVKTAVALQCGVEDTLRLPLTPMTDGNRERLRGVLKELRLL